MTRAGHEQDCLPRETVTVWRGPFPPEREAAQGSLWRAAQESIQGPVGQCQLSCYVTLGE